MSSCYSSRRSSFAEAVSQVVSKSAPATPAKPRQNPVFHTVPDSPRHNKLLSEDHGLDLEILTHKLQLYQLELEEAELRLMHRKKGMNDNAADVEAAARFREELEKHGEVQQLMEIGSRIQHSRSVSLQAAAAAKERPSTSGGLPKLVRSKRPEPLQLSAAPVQPQEVQSAALPVRRQRDQSVASIDAKRHWRRTTISAGRSQASNIVMISSPGMMAKLDYMMDIPPVPQLSAPGSNTSNTPILSPITPMAQEDQLRRELEVFVLKEGPSIGLSRRSSIQSRKNIPVAFVPAAEDRLLPTSPVAPGTPSTLSEALDDTEDESVAVRPGLVRKKSFFSRFERKNEVDALLDLYMTDEQLSQEKIAKRKSVKSRRQTFFKRWQSNDIPFHKTEKPR